MDDETHVAYDSRWKEVAAAAIRRGQADAPAPKQHRSRARRAEILQAAVRIFARDGVARARIADIAADAGVPLSSVYDYFTDKEDIAFALPITHMTAFFTEFFEKAAGKATSRERVHLFLWLTVDFARRNQEWARMLYLEIWPSVAVGTSLVRQTLDDYARILVELIAEGERNGEWTDPDPYQTATILIGSTSQTIVTWLLYKNPRDIMRATVALVERLLTLLPPPAAAGTARSRGREAASEDSARPRRQRRPDSRRADRGIPR